MGAQLSLGSSKQLPRIYSKPLPGNEPKDVKKKHHTYRNGDKYKGTYVDGSRHGERGIYAWKTYGGDYDGNWKDGKHHGRGKYVWPDGDSYEGEFDDDKICGRGVFSSVVLGEEFDGTFIVANDSNANPMLGSLRDGEGYCVYNSPHECEGYSYRGNWKNSYWDDENGVLSREIPGGLGEKKFTMIDEYKGSFKNGQLTGPGVALYRAGENHPWKKYAGAWLNNQWEGHGTLTFLNDNEFIGNFVQSQLKNGRFYYANGDYYDGSFVNGLRQDGKAYYHFQNHLTLEKLENAKFVMDNAVWVDKAYYKNGDKYFGPWDQDENVPHGSNGTMEYEEDDKLYVGDWVYGNRHGLGKCDYGANNPYNAGQCYTGQWADDAWNGFGTLTFESGDMYVGQFNSGKKDGHGTFTYNSNENFKCPVQLISFAQNCSNGRPIFGEYVGEWKNDTRTGKGRCVFGSPDTYYDGTWDRDVINGSGVFVCEDYEYSGEWSQNEFHGRGDLKWIRSGDSYSGQFDQGVIHGTGTITHKTHRTFVGAYDTDLAVPNPAYHVKYTGEFDNAVRHGRGIMHYGAANVFYDGDWDQGTRAGNGTFSCPHFEYTGQWANDVKEGSGTLTSEFHDYEGDWKNDVIDGKGKLTLHSSGESYNGDFVNDKPHGFGKIFYAEGDLKFEGKFSNGKRTYGVFNWREYASMDYDNQWYRSTYDGDWTDVNDLEWGDKFPDGHGKMVWKNDQGYTRTYVGDWKNGKCNGKGKLTISRGTPFCDETYEGYFSDGEFHGPDGHHTLPSKADPSQADIYVGEFVNGKRHGKGNMYRAEDKSSHEGVFDMGYEKPSGTWHLKGGDVDTFEGSYADSQFDQETGRRGVGMATKMTYSITKDVYVGEVKGVTKHGQGEYTLKAKKGFTYRSYKGTFQDDQFHGEGTLTYRGYMDEKEYTGGFKNCKRHGYGTITYKNGDVYVGDISDDMRHGQGKLTFGRDGWVEGQWRKDLLDGDVKYSHRDGFIYEGPYVEQRKDGANAVCKFADGSEYKGEVKRGKIHGTGILTFKASGKDPTKRKVYEGEFKDGKQHGRGKFIDEDGSIYEGQFVDGLMQGRGKITYPNKTVYDGEWKEGFKHGDGEFKSPDGKVLERGRFHNGIFVNNQCCPAPVQLITCDFSKFKMWYNKWSSADPKILAKKNKKRDSKSRQAAPVTNLGSAAASGKEASSSKTAEVTPRLNTPEKPARSTVLTM